MKTVSSRAQKLIASPIRKFFPLAESARKKGVEVLKLNIGDPDLMPPQALFRTLAKLAKLSNFNYAPSSGIELCVSAWQKYYQKLGLKFEKENIIPTVGASEAIQFALWALADPGDEIIVFEPLFTNYKALAALLDVKLRPVTLKLKDNFQLPGAKEIVRLITKKTKAILIINPDNPTGKVWQPREIKEVIDIARKYNLAIIADETYREINFIGQTKSILSYNGAKERTILIDSLSKRFTIPGMRTGVIATTNAEWSQTILKIAMARLSAPTIGQLVTAALLGNARKYTDEIRIEYKKRSAVVQTELKKISGITINQPQGAFYQVVGLPVKDAEDFIRFMLTEFSHRKKTVWVSPMADFYITPGLGKNEIRLAYVLESKKLREAVEILGRGLVAYQKTFKHLNI
ncbi:MAG TPA: pyridoxal phosphate-dependent aminotransferase [Patescibacteria group bacterium]|nr:pyridoxal phosphate-dependent aminotransferase [Patescibacteria group bacterium]